MPSKLIEKTKTKDVFYGFNYDKMFKAIFVGFNEDRTHLLCELLSECLDIKIDRIIKFIPVELKIRQKSERSKRLDLLVEAQGRKINLELNSSYSEITKVRNINFYFSFCSQKTLVSQAYDTVSEFIHISLNYKVKPTDPLITCYTFYDKNNKKELDNRFKYYEINVEKFAKLWYDKDMKSAREKPLLTMLGIKNKEDLEKYCSEIKNSSVKESVDKLKRLNKEDVFIYDITPEEEEKYIQNTEKNIARREGLAEGLAEGRAEGHEAGLAEGQKVEKESIAKKLLEANYPIDEIIKITDLSKEEVEKISKK